MTLHAPEHASHVLIPTGCGEGHEPGKDGSIDCAKCRKAVEAFTEDEFRASGLTLHEDEEKAKEAPKTRRRSKSDDAE